MEVLAITPALFVVSLGAGFVGALSGLGGGVVIIPILTLGMGVHIRYAIGASLVSVIATSSGAASAYVREGFTNLRVGMLLEIATTLGALAGATLVAHVPTRVIAVVFGLVLLFSARFAGHSDSDHPVESVPASGLARHLRLDSTYPAPEGARPYRVHNVAGGFGLMGLAGVLSGLLGIGSGAVKVLAMDQVMRLPFKVSTTTSNFMIGVTAAASAGVYLRRGYVDPGLVMPVMLGVLAGSTLGARMLAHADVPRLRLVFRLLIVALGLQMIVEGLRGSIRP
jgi:uncharacterized membrane protein YfcA